jgi:uncharacterized protein with ParB-like and HNH nuclease domain
MKPTTLTLFELFEKERRYTVPLFQRPYVWERQWAHLWTDVRTRADAILQTGDEPYALRKHFLGAVVLNHVKVYGRQVPAVEVIDGQQRLTTLQIVLASLRDVLTAAGDSGYANTLRRVTQNTCRMEDETERFKVWPTNADRETFQKVVTAGSPEEVGRQFPRTRKKYARKFDPQPKLVEAYLYFYKVISGYVAPELSLDNGAGEPSTTAAGVNDRGSEEARLPADRERVDALVEAISHHLELVIIELEERDDPQAIFESLNGLGAPLLPSDLIRNFVFQQAVRAQLPTEKLYLAHWRPFDSNEFWQVEERQGRLKRKRFDLYIFHYLTNRTERDLNIGQLYQDFKDWWAAAPRNVEAELEALKLVSGYFQSFIEPDTTDFAATFYSRLRAIDTSTVYPVLLSVLEEWGDPDYEEVRRIFRSLESYLVRRMVCTLTAKNYNRVFLTLLRELHKSGYTADVVDAHLGGLDGESVRWPTDDEFKGAWLALPAYTTLGSGKTRMVLEALEGALRTKFQEHIVLQGYLSVEHVMPQGWDTGHWPLQSDSEVPDAEEQARILRERLIHTFGNLTLVSSYLNPSISNGPFFVKKPRIAEQSALRLNTHFQNCGDAWGEAEILNRGKQLFEVARQVWPHPSSEG